MTRTATTNVHVSWTAPSTGPALGGYEVFYQAGSNVFSSSTESASATQLTLTGLVVEQEYSIFVVAFGPEGAPVLPSAHSNTMMITLGEFISYSIGNLCNCEIYCQQVKKCFTTKENKTSKTERLQPVGFKMCIVDPFLPHS